MNVLARLVAPKTDLHELENDLAEAGLVVQRPSATRGDPVAAIIVALGSAGAFTTFAKVAQAWLERQTSRTLTISLSPENRQVTLTGHTAHDEAEILALLAPALFTDPARPPHSGRIGAGKVRKDHH